MFKHHRQKCNYLTGLIYVGWSVLKSLENHEVSANTNMKSSCPSKPCVSVCNTTQNTAASSGLPEDISGPLWGRRNLQMQQAAIPFDFSWIIYNTLHRYTKRQPLMVLLI